MPHNPLFAPLEDGSEPLEEVELPSEPPRLFEGAVFALIFEAIAVAVLGIGYSIMRFLFF